MPSSRDRPALLAVRPLELVAYLRSSGWAQARVVDGKWSTWTKDEYEVLAPLSADYADFASRMADALAILEVAEDRSQSEVLTDLLTNASTDIVRIRLDDADAADGSIPIEEAARAVENARLLMLASACAEVERRPLYHTRKPGPAVDYINRVRLGQTERGSFIFTILSRVPPELRVDQPALFQLPPPEPFQRRVVRRLASALLATKGAAQRAAADGHFGDFQEAVIQGVSANLCDAIYGLAATPDHIRGVEIDFSWARSRPLEAPASVARVVFPPDVMPVISEAARLFREMAPREEFELRGLVVKLERAEGAPRGKVTILGLVDGAGRKVVVDLALEDYHRAVEAHDTESTVRLRGVLAREGRILFLRGANGLEVEPADAG